MDSGINKAIHLLQQENIHLKEQLEISRDENEALQSYIKGISSLYQAANTIVSQDNLFKLLDEILYQALVIIEADHGSLLLVDEETEELVFVMVHGEFRESLQGYRMSIAQGIAGWVARNGKSLVINHVRYDPRFSSEVDHTFGLTTQKILAVPLKFGQKVLGVIELVNKKETKDFTESDATILSLLGSFAALSLEHLNTTLEEEEETQTSTE